jgi:hypothetical protein
VYNVPSGLTAPFALYAPGSYFFIFFFSPQTAPLYKNLTNQINIDCILYRGYTTVACSKNLRHCTNQDGLLHRPFFAAGFFHPSVCSHSVANAVARVFASLSCMILGAACGGMKTTKSDLQIGACL